MLKPDIKSCHVSQQLKYTSPLLVGTFHPKRRQAITAAENYKLQSWDLATGKVLDWEAHDSWIRDIKFHPDGQTFYSAGSDDKVIAWSLTTETPKEKFRLNAHKGWVRCLALTADGRTLVSAGNDRIIKLWDTEKGRPLQSLTGHDLDIYSVWIDPKGRFLLSGDQGGTMIHWELPSGKILRRLEAKEFLTNDKQGVRYGGIRSLAFSAEGKQFLACGLHKATNPLGAVNEPLIVQFDWESGKKIRSHLANGVRAIGWKVFYLSDGSFVCGAGGSGGGFLLFWTPDSEKPMHQMKLPDTVRDLHLQAEGIELLTVHYDRNVRISKLSAQAKPAPTKPQTPPKKKN